MFGRASATGVAVLAGHHASQDGLQGPALRSNECRISRGQREVPEQLLTTDLRELPKSRQLLAPEYPRRREPQPPKTPTNLIGSRAERQPSRSAARTEITADQALREPRWFAPLLPGPLVDASGDERQQLRSPRCVDTTGTGTATQRDIRSGIQYPARRAIEGSR